MLFLVAIIVNVFFAISVYKTAKLIPEKFHSFPVWFCWLFIIPFVGTVFKWMILPFDIPQALRQYKPEDAAITRSADKLFKLGLAYVILISIAFLAMYGLIFAVLLVFLGVFILIAVIVLLILYWVEIVSIRKQLAKSS